MRGEEQSEERRADLTSKRVVSDIHNSPTHQPTHPPCLTFSSLSKASFSIDAFKLSSFSLCSLSLSSFSFLFFSSLSLSCLAVSSNSRSWEALRTLPMTFSYLLLAKAARLGLCTANVLLTRVVSWVAIPLIEGERPFILESRAPCLTRSIGRPSPHPLTLPSSGPSRSTAHTTPAQGSFPILR